MYALTFTLIQHIYLRKMKMQKNMQTVIMVSKLKTDSVTKLYQESNDLTIKYGNIPVSCLRCVACFFQLESLAFSKIRKHCQQNS